MSVSEPSRSRQDKPQGFERRGKAGGGGGNEAPEADSQKCGGGAGGVKA